MDLRMRCLIPTVLIIASSLIQINAVGVNQRAGVSGGAGNLVRRQVDDGNVRLDGVNNGANRDDINSHAWSTEYVEKPLEYLIEKASAPLGGPGTSSKRVEEALEYLSHRVSAPLGGAPSLASPLDEIASDGIADDTVTDDDSLATGASAPEEKQDDTRNEQAAENLAHKVLEDGSVAGLGPRNTNRDNNDVDTLTKDSSFLEISDRGTFEEVNSEEAAAKEAAEPKTKDIDSEPRIYAPKKAHKTTGKVVQKEHKEPHKAALSKSKPAKLYSRSHSKVHWQPVCRDRGQYCQKYKDIGWCEKYPEMMKSCLKSCGMCKAGCPLNCGGCFHDGKCRADHKKGDSLDITEKRCEDGGGLWCQDIAATCPHNCDGCFVEGKCRLDVKQGYSLADTRDRCVSGGGSWCIPIVDPISGSPGGRIAAAKNKWVGTPEASDDGPKGCQTCDGCFIHNACLTDTIKGETKDATKNRCLDGGGEWCHMTPPPPCPTKEVCNGCFVGGTCQTDSKEEHAHHQTLERCMGGGGRWCAVPACPHSCKGCWIDGKCRLDANEGDSLVDTRDRCVDGGGDFCIPTEDADPATTTAAKETKDCRNCDGCFVDGLCRLDAKEGDTDDDTRKRCEGGGGEWCVAPKPPDCPTETPCAGCFVGGKCDLDALTEHTLSQTLERCMGGGGRWCGTAVTTANTTAAPAGD